MAVAATAAAQTDVPWPYVLSRPEQYAATVALLLAVAALVGLVYLAGPYLKSRMESDSAEALQASFVTAIGIAAGVTLVVVWRADDEVRSALSVIEPTPEDGVKVLITMLAFGVAYTGTRLTKRFVRFGEGRDAITNHQREILHHVLQIVVFLPAVVFTIALWNVPAQNLLLSASVLGVVLGLAARQTLGAMLAGFVLLFSRPFEVGDWVEIEDSEGIVTDISIVNTQLQTFDDEMVMIPNDQILEKAIVNRTRNNRLRVQVDVGVDYETDVARAADVALTAMDDIDVLMDGPEPDVVVERFGDSAVVLNLRFWIENPTIQRKWAAQNEVIEAVKGAFDREGITIPFPQRVLSNRGAGEFSGAADRADEAESGDAEAESADEEETPDEDATEHPEGETDEDGSSGGEEAA